MNLKGLEANIKKMYMDSDRGPNVVSEISNSLNISEVFVKSIIRNIDEVVLLEQVPSTSTYDSLEHDVLSKNIDEELESRLSLQQRLFCCYYVESFNPRLSAIKAGMPNDHLLSLNVRRLMKDPDIIAFIEVLSRKLMHSVMISAEDIIARHAKIAFSDMADFLEWGSEDIDQDVRDIDGTVIDTITVTRDYVRIKDMNVVDSTLVKKIKKTKEGIELEIEDRAKSLDVLTNLMLLTKAQQEKVEVDRARARLDVKEAAIELASKVKELSDVDMEVFINELQRK